MGATTPVRPHPAAVRDTAALWTVPPQGVTRDDPVPTIAAGLGAVMYVPAVRPDLIGDLIRVRESGAVAAVLCLEDAVHGDDLPRAEANVLTSLQAMADVDPVLLPLIFLRPRRPDHLVDLASRAGRDVVSVFGYAMPKFDSVGATDWYAALTKSAELAQRVQVGMPIIEGTRVLHRETRMAELLALRTVFAEQAHQTATVRLGGTDLCGLLGLRRNLATSIYDIHAVKDLIADVVNVLGRPQDDLSISGAVWEYYAGDAALQGLIDETRIDMINGLTGKTVIHPGHIRVVNALQAVTAETWHDAQQIAGADRDGGAMTSPAANKMNEARPHRVWAQRTLRRGRIHGVLAEAVDHRDLWSR